MSTPTFYIKTGDLLPAIRAQLVGAGGSIQKLPNGVTVRFHLNDAVGASVVDAPAVIESEARGVVAYEWVLGDTDTAGTYTAEFEVEIAGKTMTFPNDGDITVVISPELA